NWDPAAPSLEERFATMGFYYDMLFGLTDNGLEVTGPPLRWVENTNWKFASDNLVGDGYHTMSVHKSMDQLGLVPGFADPTLTQNVTSVFDEATGDGLENFGIFPVGGSRPSRRRCSSRACPAWGTSSPTWPGWRCPGRRATRTRG